MGSLRLCTFNFALSWEIKDDEKAEAATLTLTPAVAGIMIIVLLSGLQTHSASHHRLAFAFLTVAGEEVGFSQPVVAILCGVQKVNVADEDLETENNAQHVEKKKMFFFFWPVSFGPINNRLKLLKLFISVSYFTFSNFFNTSASHSLN